MAETFRRRKDGEEWALEMERNIDRGKGTRPRARLRLHTFGDLIDLHGEDMKEIGKPPRRSKAAVMEALKKSLGHVKIPSLNRERLIEYEGKRTFKEVEPPERWELVEHQKQLTLARCPGGDAEGLCQTTADLIEDERTSGFVRLMSDGGTTR